MRAMRKQPRKAPRDGSLAAREARPADDDGRDDLEGRVAAGGYRGGAETSRHDDAGQGGHDARKDVAEDLDLHDLYAGKLRGPLITADVIILPQEFRVAEEDISDDDGDDGYDDGHLDADHLGLAYRLEARGEARHVPPVRYDLEEATEEHLGAESRDEGVDAHLRDDEAVEPAHAAAHDEAGEDGEGHGDAGLNEEARHGAHEGEDGAHGHVEAARDEEDRHGHGYNDVDREPEEDGVEIGAGEEIGARCGEGRAEEDDDQGDRELADVEYPFN